MRISLFSAKCPAAVAVGLCTADSPTCPDSPGAPGALFVSTALSGWVLRSAGWGAGFPGRRVKPWPGIKPSACRLHCSELPAAAAEEYPSPFPPDADVGSGKRMDEINSINSWPGLWSVLLRHWNLG